MTVTLGQLRDDFPKYAKLVLKIAPKKGSLVPFVLNEAQRKINAVVDHEIRRGRPPRIITLKARQRGISTWAQARMFHRVHLRPQRSALVIAHKDQSARQLFRMSHRFYKNMPRSLRWQKRAENRREIHFEKNDSRIQVEVEGEVRSYTAQYVHVSEFAFFTKDPEGTLDAVLNAVPAQVDSLVVIESTPNGIGNEFHNLWVNAKLGKNDFVPVFLPWFEEEEYRMPSKLTEADLDDEEKSIRAAYGLDFEQIEWMRWCVRNNCRGDMEKFRQEYPFDDRSCFLVSGRPVFQPAALQVIRDAQEIRFGAGEVFEAEFDKAYPPQEISEDAETKKPKVEPAVGGRLRIYKPPIIRRTYTCGWDPSAGDPGSDYSPGAVIDNLTLDLVATWIGKLPPDRLMLMACLVGRYYNDAMVVWEANNHGAAFGIGIDELGYPNLYLRTTTKDSTSQAITDKLGFLTTPKNRSFLFDNARAVVAGIGRGEFKIEMWDPWLLSQMEGMAYTKDNPRSLEREEPRSYRNDDPHFKDDLLIAYCLAIEGRKAYPTEPIRPLSVVEKVEVLEYAKGRLAAGHDIHSGVVDRLNVTAAELEEIDEWAARRARARQRRGTGGMV